MKSETDEYKDFKELIDESKKDLSGYIEKKLELTKLKLYEKTARAYSLIVYSLTIVTFALILFFLLLLTLGFFLGEILQNYVAGFALLVGAMSLILLILLMSRKFVKRVLMNIAIRAIKKIENDED